MAPTDEYAEFRDAPGCGHKTGTPETGPQICGKTPEFTVHESFWLNANGLACGTHAKAAKRSLYAVIPIIEEI
jgi:hypothetical protein